MCSYTDFEILQSLYCELKDIVSYEKDKRSKAVQNIASKVNIIQHGKKASIVQIWSPYEEASVKDLQIITSNVCYKLLAV